MTDVDWDALQVGDPDPTSDDEPWCMAKRYGVTYSNGGVGVAYCTRAPHEDGPHVAGNGILPERGVDFGRSVVAIWPSDG